jgi:hypothetical protein
VLRRWVDLVPASSRSTSTGSYPSTTRRTSRLFRLRGPIDLLRWLWSSVLFIVTWFTLPYSGGLFDGPGLQLSYTLTNLDVFNKLFDIKRYVNTVQRSRDKVG